MLTLSAHNVRGGERYVLFCIPLFTPTDVCFEIHQIGLHTLSRHAWSQYHTVRSHLWYAVLYGGHCRGGEGCIKPMVLQLGRALGMPAGTRTYEGRSQVDQGEVLHWFLPHTECRRYDHSLYDCGRSELSWP